MSSPKSVDLLDVNVWLALTDGSHELNTRALAYWTKASQPTIAWCRVTMLSYMRLVTHATVMGGFPLNPVQAWSAYEEFMRQPGVIMAVEPPDVSATLKRWSASEGFGNRQWMDCYLASFAASADFRIVTFDQGFVNYDGLHRLIL